MIVDKTEDPQNQRRGSVQQNPPPAYELDLVAYGGTPSFPQASLNPNQAHSPPTSLPPSPPLSGAGLQPNSGPLPPLGPQPYPNGSLSSRQGSNGIPSPSHSHFGLSPQPTGSLNHHPIPPQASINGLGSQQWGQQQQQPGPQRAMSAAELGERYRAEQFALCASGKHEPSTKYGVWGIICAIIFFPIGFICMFMDVEERCTRCGNVL